MAELRVNYFKENFLQRYLLYLFQPHSGSQHPVLQPQAGPDHGRPPLLHRHPVRHLSVSQARAQHIRGLSGTNQHLIGQDSY